MEAMLQHSKMCSWRPGLDWGESRKPAPCCAHSPPRTTIKIYHILWMYHKKKVYNPRLGGKQKNPLLVMPLLLGHTKYTIKLTITYSRYTNSNTRPGLDWREQKTPSFLSFFYKEILTTTRDTKITNTNTRPKLSKYQK